MPAPPPAPDISLRPFFAPAGVAVFGVSTAPGNLGAFVVGNLLRWRFAGPIVPIGRRPGQVHGLAIVPDAEADAALAGCDLAVILTPAPTVAGLVRRLAALGIRHAIVESGGFAEFEGGADATAALRAALAETGARLLGPNCVGLFDLRTRCVVTFAAIEEGRRPGDLAVIAQSGGVGLSYARLLDDLGLGVGQMASIGNKLDVDEVDLAAHLLERPVRAGATDADADAEPGAAARAGGHAAPRRLVFYLESMARGRRLCDLARAHPDVPFVVHKANRSAASAGAARSHTAALANDDAVVDAALEQAGAIRAQSGGEVLLAALAAGLPPLGGRRVAVLARSGGHAVMAADACAAAGFQLPPLPADLARRYDELHPQRVIHYANPVDLGDIFDFSKMATMTAAALASPAFDAVLFVVLYDQAVEGPLAAALWRAMAPVAVAAAKSLVIACVADAAELAAVRQAVPGAIVNQPEDAVRVLALHARRCEALTAAAGPRVAPPAFERSRIAPGLARLLEPAAAGTPLGTTVLAVADSLRLLAAAGLPIATGWLLAVDPLAQHQGHRSPGGSAGAPAAVVDPASLVPLLPDGARLPPDPTRVPLALKWSGPSPAVVHKLRAGLVALGLGDQEALARAAAEIQARAAAAGLPPGQVLAQPMLAGPQVFLGARRDPAFGPLVVVGCGGSDVELLADARVWPYPFTLPEVEALVARTRLGARLGSALDIPRLAAWLSALGALLERFPALVEIDVNPLVFGPQGPQAIDARAVCRVPAGASVPRPGPLSTGRRLA